MASERVVCQVDALTLVSLKSYALMVHELKGLSIDEAWVYAVASFVNFERDLGEYVNESGGYTLPGVSIRRAGESESGLFAIALRGEWADVVEEGDVEARRSQLRLVPPGGDESE